MNTKISATELARSLSDILSGVRYKGDSFVVERNGQAVARLEPVGPVSGITARLTDVVTAPRFFVDVD